MPNAVHYLIFLGFPDDIELAERDNRSKRRPKRKPAISSRTYSGIHVSTKNWQPGEPRALESESRINNHTGQPVLIFDADHFVEKVCRDFSEHSDGWAHFPEKVRAHYGFRKLDAAGYKKAQKSFAARVED